MAGPSETLESPWPPPAIRPWNLAGDQVVELRTLGKVWAAARCLRTCSSFYDWINYWRHTSTDGFLLWRWNLLSNKTNCCRGSVIVYLKILHCMRFENHGRMARGGHGLPKVSLGPTMTDPYTPCALQGGRPAASSTPLDTPRHTPTTLLTKKATLLQWCCRLTNLKKLNI
jgi:hypothetical protein